MKNFLLISTFFLTVHFASGQVIYSQNFDNTLAWTVAHPAGTSTNAGWARATIGAAPSCFPFAGAGMARFNSYNIASNNTYSLTSPSFELTGAKSRVTFKMYRDIGDPAADKIQVFLNTVANHVGGISLGIINRPSTLAPIVSAEGWYSYSFDFPDGSIGTKYISILATSKFGNNIFLDEVVVSQIQNNDVELSSLNLQSIFPPTSVGNNPIAGSLKNTGLNNITSVDLNWQEDSGVISTQSLTGLNIAPNGTIPFTHNVPWNVTVGTFFIKVWLSNINGTIDPETSNNEIIRKVAVASNSTTRFPLFEKFTSSTCPPCATFDEGFGPFYSANKSNLALINYQVNWPGAGDPYYTNEIGLRRNFYGVSGAPTMYIDAVSNTNSNPTALNTNLSLAQSRSAFFGLTAEYNIVGNNVIVDVNTLPYLTGQYRLFAAVVEKITTGNASSNGETEFKNVLMKMLPSASGQIIDCTHDIAITSSFAANVLGGTYLDPTLVGGALTAAPNLIHTEDINDLEVIVFVQDYGTKMIMQSTKAVLGVLSNKNFENTTFKLTPNPSKGIVSLNNQNQVQIKVTDLLGKEVYSTGILEKNETIDLSKLQKGIYLVKVSGENINSTQKVILE